MIHSHLGTFNVIFAVFKEWANVKLKDPSLLNLSSNTSNLLKSRINNLEKKEVDLTEL